MVGERVSGSTSRWLAALQAKLDERRKESSLRALRPLSGACQSVVRLDSGDAVNFSSNDYLGLANHPALIEATAAAVRRHGVGAGASPLVTGFHQLHQALAARLATMTGRESVLLLGSGFSANKLLLQTLATKNDVIFQDRLNHASLIDGARYSEASLLRYRHLDCEDLQRLLQAKGASAEAGRNFIVSDSVFSMDGDIAPASQMAELARDNNGVLMLDDAHGFGVLGEAGGGIAEEAGLDQAKLPILMGTLGKALGGYGAFIAGSATLIDTLINFGRSYIYSTATPPALAASTLAAIDLLQAEPERRQRLFENIAYFKRGLAALGIPHSNSRTPVQAVMLGDNERALRWQHALQLQGFLVVAIRPPTVPANTARLRIALSAAHSRHQIEGLLTAMAKLSGDQGDHELRSSPARSC